MIRIGALGGLGVAAVTVATFMGAGAGGNGQAATRPTGGAATTTAAAKGSSTDAVNASAIINCQGASCTGLDPVHAGCAGDAYTVATRQTAVGTVELRYSNLCKANWARISNAKPGQSFFVLNSLNEIESFQVPSGSTNAYTNMVNGFPTAEGCTQSGTLCTGFF